MSIANIKNILVNKLQFSEDSIKKMAFFHDNLIEYNKKYNLISKSTEPSIWHRHILDSAQIVKFIDFKSNSSLADLGTGAGFPGVILSIFNQNPNFHVKLYEKSRIKCLFLENLLNKINIKAEIIFGDCNNKIIDSEYIVCRAFKKLDKILYISREKSKKSHKLIILKGKNAQDEINKASRTASFNYTMESSITDKDSKIIIIDARKK